ncbi:MAG: class I SAM-dependent methyltransferase [Phycisphaerae bacterium]
MPAVKLQQPALPDRSRKLAKNSPTQGATMRENKQNLVDSRQDTLQRAYGIRFEGKTHYRTKVWQVLAPFICQWTPVAGNVLDLGSGYCEFINNVKAGKKYAMDLNPDVHHRAAEGVVIFQQDCSEPWPLAEGELDAVFTSNFLEHLPNKDLVLATLADAYRCLKPGGTFISMGPNIKYVPGAYWDFFDHYVQLTELSLAEALKMCGFEMEKVVGRFLPYTMSDGRQYPLWMLQWYLAFPAVWPIFGKQFLVIARKP